jgi:RNA polymerase sigma-70 factor (ECF subfamily)
MRPFTDGKLDAIEELYRERFSHFVGVATAVAGDREVGVEAVQDAFADVVRSRRRFRGEGPLEAWVWRAVVNAARKSRRLTAAELDVEQRRNGHEPDTHTDLLELVAALPERQRLAVFLRYYADLDYRSIAEALEIEVGTVSATLSAAHTALRRGLKEAPR